MGIRLRCIDCGKMFTKTRPRCKMYEGFVSFTFSCTKCYFDECPETFKDEIPDDKTREWVVIE